MICEERKDIKGYEGKYMISNLGRVKSMNYNNSGREGLLTITERGGKYKYTRVDLSKKNKHKGYLVHRLVAIAFIENEKKLSEVNHIDGNKKNNIASNLEWCTRSDNCKHSFRILGRKKPTGVKK